MAGIGFELKKLYKNKGFAFNLRALFYASLVTVGPQILCMLMITSLQILLKVLDVSFKERELFVASTVYAFIFSQVITCGFSMIVTRYISDKLYVKEFDKIKASLYGVISINIIIGGVIGVLFLATSPINLSVKVLTYTLYMQLIIMWLETVYLSAIKDYIKIVKSFLLGSISAVILGWILLKISVLAPSVSLLIAINLGVFIIVTLIMFYIQSYFRECSTKYFEFLIYIDKYGSLFLTNLLYTLALYMHNFIYWTSGLGRKIEDTYLYAPAYDMPTFYALLTIMPAMVLFVVSVETSFYDKYKEYYSLITDGGILKDIIRAKKDMIRTLWQEILRLMEIQLFFTILFIIIGGYLLPYIGMTEASIETFNILSVGAYCNVVMLIVILIELYFENRKGALIITSTFLISNTFFTMVTLKLGEDYYGLGFFLSTFLSLILGIIDISKMLKDIDYITFCSQPMVYKEKKGFFTYIVNWRYNRM